MARARNLKPGFFTDDELCELPPLVRILFAGLWCLSDRKGRLEDRPRKIKAEILPYDECDCGAMLAQLHDAGFISRYSRGGVRYIQIDRFTKHQNPHVKEPDSTIPEPCEHCAYDCECTGLERCEEPTIPEATGLIPDSGFPQPDSGFPQPAPGADPPDGVDADVWKAWVKHKGRKQTAAADRLQRKHLAEWQSDGHDVNRIVEDAVAGHWSGLHAPDRRRANRGPPSSLSERRSKTIDDVIAQGKGNGRIISGTAERVDRPVVPALPVDLREQGPDDVRGSGRG